MTKEERTRLQKKALKVLAMKKLAENNFWYFCKAMDPDFFKDEKEYLRDLCERLNWFHDCPTDECDTLVLSMPPRSGKTYALILYETYCKCKNTKSKSIVVCYNNELSLNFSKSVRDKISEPKMDKYKLVANDIFPNAKLKRGSSSKKMWSLSDSQQLNFLASSPTSTLTGLAAGGIGGNIIVDDLIRDAYTANNERLLNKQWEFFTSTLFSRREPGRKLIICFTRWSTKDLIAKFDDWCNKNHKNNVTHITYKMIKEDGTTLHDSIMTIEEAKEARELIGEQIWNANYQQSPEDNGEKLYTQLRAYTNKEEYYDGYGKLVRFENDIKLKPENHRINNIYCCVDTADTGGDYTAACAFYVYNGMIFIKDIFYTQKKMEVTEELLAKFLHDNEVKHCVIEGNNGGVGFARNVARILKQEYKNNFTYIEPFTQTKNKSARIFSNASDVQRLVYFPYDAFTRYDDNGYHICENKMWKDAIEHLISFTNVEDMEHDDIEDVITLIVEFCYKNQLIQSI